MKLSVEGQRVIITGGAEGIGWAIARTFLDNGAQVHICDVNEARMAQRRTEYPQLGTSVADVSNPAQVEQLFADAVAHMGGLDVLVNNAGVAGPTAPVEEVSIEAWDRTLAVVISSQFYCARLAVPLLKQAGQGNIINLSSTAGQFGFPLRSPYSAGKWAVIGFTKTLAMELAEFNIRVNAICPGSVDGPRMDRVIAANAEARNVEPDVVRAEFAKHVSMNTFIDVQDIANMAYFLCTPAARLITGQALAVDGHTETLR